MMFLEGNIAAPPTMTVFSWALTGATTVAVRARAPKATAESRAIRLDMETSPDLVNGSRTSAADEGLQRRQSPGLRSLGFDCVVVAPSYGRVLRPVSKKDSLRGVKLSAVTNVICLSGTRKSISERP